MEKIELALQIRSKLQSFFVFRQMMYNDVYRVNKQIEIIIYIYNK